MGKTKVITHALTKAFCVSLCFLPFDVAAQTTDDVPKIDTSKLLVPNSSEVFTQNNGVIAPGKFQRGSVGEWGYELYADGTARVMRGDNQDSATIEISCELGVACEIAQRSQETVSIAATGAPYPATPTDVDGTTLARFVAQSILAGTGTPIPVVNTVMVEPNKLAPLETPKDVVVVEARADAKPLQSAEVQVEQIASVDKRPEPSSPKREVAPKPKKQAARPSKAAKPQRFVKPVSAPVKAVQSEQAPAVTRAAKPRLSFAKKYRLACSVSATTNLSAISQNGDDNRQGKPRGSFGCYARLSEKLSGRVALVRYLDASQQEDWDPDFTFDFSYKMTKKLTLRYSNYGARFNGDGHSFAKSLIGGTVRASYKLPELKLPFDKIAKCSASIRLPDPRRSSANLYCGVKVSDKLFVAGTAHAYFPGTQKSWQPDFTYTATYKISDQWNLTYSNYGNNRFPWNAAATPGKGILGGSLTIAYKIKF